ncbi:MAG: hypothetical protein C4547_07535 [Phycisphaerales bacterium]|nr:MAG: hypothetical protein C4547_07535 [Phycisphaerales bacterium]
MVTSATRVWVAGHARRPRPLIERLVAGGVRPAEGPIDLAVIAAVSAEELAHFVQKVARRFHAGSELWVVCSQAATGPDDPVSLDALGSLGMAVLARAALERDWIAVRVSP